MKFKIDENLPAKIADDLRALGHEAMTVVDQGMTGFDDARLMVRVQDESRDCWGFMSRGAWPWSATRQSGSVEKRHERACDSAPRDGH